MPHSSQTGRIDDSRQVCVLGVDIGGTFTDLALVEKATGRVMIGKVLTNYADIAAGATQGIEYLLLRSAVAAADVNKIVHGTTLITNALIERRGAITALIVTRGFRDVLSMARESRYDIFDIDIQVPDPLVPRSLVFEVAERVNAKGEVITPLDQDELQGLIPRLQAAGVAAAGICFLHSFRNPTHERAAAKLLAERAPQIAISLSSDVAPDIREYERANTTVANAYVQPVVEAYLTRLSDGLAALGIRGKPLLIASDGGTIAPATALRYPVRLIESGPAGGAVAAAYCGGLAGQSDLIAFDMGGTTAKICVIDGGRPERAEQFEVARVHRFAKGSGLPVKVPVLEMIEIGAGGGSTARVDELGLLRVGPDSAAADPGPACYGRGGEHATVTDADLVLGYLDPDFFLGGAMHLNRERAARAIDRHVAGPSGISLLRAAWGIHAIVNDNMAHAAKVHCLEHGKDPRDYVLVAYGGAGPVHAWHVAAALGIRRVLYPLRAGVLSALGFLVAPVVFERVRSDPCALDQVDPTRANAILDDLQSEAAELVAVAGVPLRACTVLREASLRFAGQTYALPVSLAAELVSKTSLDALRAAFFDAYRRRYQRVHADIPLELVSWRVQVSGPAPDVRFAAPLWSRGPGIKCRRPVFFPESGDFIECPVYDRFRLLPGHSLQGPAVIEEPESTAVIGPGGIVQVGSEGYLAADLPAGRQVAASHEVAL